MNLASRLTCLLLVAPILGGCLERRLLITSEPPGATVTVNDVELGRTPLEADFTFYGGYDVLLEKEGFEPLREQRRISTPIYEYPPVDLLAEAVPAKIRKNVAWHFVMNPALETSLPRQQFESELLERARGARTNIDVDKPESDGK